MTITERSENDISLLFSDSATNPVTLAWVRWVKGGEKGVSLQIPQVHVYLNFNL